MSRTVRAAQVTGKSTVLSKALIRAADQLDLSQASLSHVLGVSAATVSRLYAGVYQLAPEKKEWEFAVLLVRLFRSLDAIVGGIREDARRWLNSQNRALADQRPVDLIISAEGLVRVVTYLDARRAVV